MEKSKRKTKLQRPISISKQETKENYSHFNKINGILLKENIIKNEFNDYILVLKCLSYKSLKYMTENMQEFKFKEMQIFVQNKEYYISLKFDKTYLKDYKKKQLNNIIKELELRTTEFKILNILEVISLLRSKVYRRDTLKNSDIRRFFGVKNCLEVLQNKILAKNVVIKNDYIVFNNDKNNENCIKHKIIGLQMYPSVLYEGFLTEINSLDNIETTTYIRIIDLEKVRNNIDSKSNKIVSEYVNSIDKLWNTCFYIHLWGTEEEIVNKKQIVLEIANKYHIILNEFFMQQRKAFSAFLPLMNNNMKCYRAISNIKGILPYNEDLIQKFNCNMKYGKELLSNKDLYYHRSLNGIIISSEKESKRRFIQDERNYIAVDLKLSYRVIDFADEKENLSNEYKEIFDDKSYTDSSEMYKIFKMYCLLCIAANRINKTIDISDVDIISDVIDKIEEKYSEFSYSRSKELLLGKIERNKLLYNKLTKYIDSPSNEVRRYINDIIRIYQSFRNEKKEYIYIYNVQEIINCLSILLKDIFSKETNSIYLVSSYNDFLLFNNTEVADIIFNAPYINIIDLKANDLAIINNYLDLPNRDLVHLRNKKNITGTLYTTECEFNYYIERSEEEDDI